MEKNIAILMADLSGYTALTETHGAVLAADLIDKYTQIAEGCLVGDTRMHQRTGDELMFISDSPDQLLATALALEANTVSEENFLQVHGGLHFGMLLKRGNNYYGSAINLVSRIAAKAEAGTFCCSDDFVNALTGWSACTFISKGNFLFKNISAAKEIFEIKLEKKMTSYIDPVCRMQILNQQIAIHHPIEDNLFFCSSQCLHIYRNTFSGIQPVKTNHSFLK